MPFTKILVALTALCMGCVGGSTNSLTDPSQGEEQPQVLRGEVGVRVVVSGDPTLGPASYGVMLDDVPSGWAAPNEILRVFPREGSYLVSLTPFSSSLFPAWCLPTSVGSRSVSVVAGRVATAEFAVDCPPLIGTAQLTLVVNASGSNVPAEFSILVARISGPPYSLAVKVPANSSTTTEVSVGALRASIVLRSNCIRSFAETIFGSAPRVLRDGGTLRLTFTVTCK